MHAAAGSWWSAHCGAVSLLLAFSCVCATEIVQACALCVGNFKYKQQQLMTMLPACICMWAAWTDTADEPCTHNLHQQQQQQQQQQQLVPWLYLGWCVPAEFAAVVFVCSWVWG
jgi:hypothetical protein